MNQDAEWPEAEGPGFSGVTTARATVHRVAGAHELTSRVFFSGAIRLCDFVLLIIVVLAGKYLGVERFGLFAFGLAFASIVVTPVIESFGPLMVKIAARQPDRVGIDLGAILPFQLVLTAALTVFVWLVMMWLHWGAERQGMVLIMMAALGARGLLEVLRSAVRGLGRLDLEFAVISVERGLLLVSTVTTLLLGGGALGVGVCFIVARAIGVGMALHWVDRLGHLVRWRFDRWAQYFVGAMPYGLSIFVGAANAQVGILCLAWLWNDAVTGSYSAAYHLFEGAASLAQVLVLVLLPELAARHAAAPETAAPLVRKTTAYSALVALPLTAGFLVEGPWLIEKLFGANYHEAVPALRILAIGLLPMFTRQIARVALWALDRQRAALVVSAAGGITTVVLSLWLIPPYGAAGAATAMLLSGSLVWALMWYLLSQEGIRWPWVSATIKPAIVATTVSLALLNLQASPWLIRLGLAGVAGLVTVLATKAITSSEWGLLSSLPSRLAARNTR